MGFVGLAAGFLAGVLGIGGGMVVGPLLISYGVLPDCTTATSSFMIVFSSSIAIL